MIAPLLAAYACGWILTTGAILVVWRPLTEHKDPPSAQRYVTVSLVAGALWPLLLVGAAELGSLMALGRRQHS